MFPTLREEVQEMELAHEDPAKMVLKVTKKKYVYLNHVKILSLSNGTVIMVSVETYDPLVVVKKCMEGKISATVNLCSSSVIKKICIYNVPKVCGFCMGYQ